MDDSQRYKWLSQKPGESAYHIISINKSDGGACQHVIPAQMKQKFLTNNQQKWIKYWEVTYDTHMSGKDIFKYYMDSNGNLAYDDNYTVILMHFQHIQKKHISRLKKKVDAELSKDTPDIASVLKWQHTITKITSWTPLQSYTQALANLNEDVANGQPDKPAIRALLISKIASLTPDAQTMPAN